MPRPKTKSELLDLSQKNYDRLHDLIDGMDKQKQKAEFPPGTMNRNIADVLMHLHHWHLMMEDWYVVGMTGEKPEMPAKGYTWKTVPELNHWIWEKYHGLDLTEAKQKLQSSHQSMMEMIQKHTNEELFEKKRYTWTGSTSLGAYLISATSSHYDWAFKLIKKVTK